MVMGSGTRKFTRSAAVGLLALIAASATARGEDAPDSQPADLTTLSLEDLMNVEVTSVSKHAQRVGDAPAAVSVIGQSDIQRSGLQSIPELLRLSPGLNVARINSSQWAISSRGFNDQFAN